MWDLKFTNSAIHLLPCRYYAAGTQPIGMSSSSSSSSSFSSSIRFASCLKNSIFRLRGRRRGRNTIFNRQHASTGNCHPAIKNLCKVRKLSPTLLHTGNRTINMKLFSHEKWTPLWGMPYLTRDGWYNCRIRSCPFPWRYLVFFIKVTAEYQHVTFNFSCDLVG